MNVNVFVGVCSYLLLQQNEFEEDENLRRERKVFTGVVEI